MWILLLPNRQGLQRMVILLTLGSEPLWPSAWPECVGELGDGEDALAVELLSLLFRHAGQQAEVVFLNRLLPAPGLKLALGTMPIQNEVRRRCVGQ